MDNDRLGVGMLVRVKPTSGRRQHWQRGRLLAVSGDEAEVFLFKHKGSVTLKTKDIQPWKAKNMENEQQAGEYVIATMVDGRMHFYRNGTVRFAPGLSGARRYSKISANFAVSHMPERDAQIVLAADVPDAERDMANDFYIVEGEFGRVWSGHGWTADIDDGRTYASYGVATRSAQILRRRAGEWLISPDDVIVVATNEAEQYMMGAAAARKQDEPEPVTVEPQEQPEWIAPPATSQQDISLLEQLAKATRAWAEAEAMAATARQELSAAESMAQETHVAWVALMNQVGGKVKG